MASTLPLVIQPSRNVKLGGERLASQRLVAEIDTQSMADVRGYARQIAEEVNAEQAAAGNPPSLVAVDGNPTKALDQIDRKVVTLFGSFLARSAMREVEMALSAAIARSTRSHTGRLADVSGSWSWRFVSARGEVKLVSASTELPPFTPGDALVLSPTHVPYATLTNRNVARSGAANKAVTRTKKGRTVSPPKKQQNRGFLFHAAETVRRRTVFKQFSVTVVFTKLHMVLGELMSREQGTGVLVIKPHIQRVRR